MFNLVVNKKNLKNAKIILPFKTMIRKKVSQFFWKKSLIFLVLFVKIRYGLPLTNSDFE